MKHIKKYLFLALFAVSTTASAIIIRHDVEDEKYQVPTSTLLALADFPGEGHGALISPQWVVTAAHVVHMQHSQEIIINGLSRKVESVVVHSGYKMPPETLIKEQQQWQLAGLASWDSSERDLRTYRGPHYGDGGNNVRISHYIAWIESTISAEEQKQSLEPAGG